MYNVQIRDTCVGFQTDLTGTAVGVANLNMILLDLRTELAQAIAVQLWEGEATVTGEAAAAHTLWNQHIVRTEFGEGNHILIHTHVTGRAGDMDGNGLVGGMEVETILQVGHDEFGRLVELHLLHHFLHAVQTGTLTTEYGILTLF